jgi:superfamily I DNA/RNA helicase
MRIVVAGAGAGKTTSMAQKVLRRLTEVTDRKIIYVITYTNAARDGIRKKIVKLNGFIPNQVLVETSHAFLLREIIFPFHHLIFDDQYTIASQIKLPDNPRFKALKLKELKENKMIHVEEVTKIAKWIISGKSKESKEVKLKRERILSIMKRYLDSIFIDEAQDMDENLAKIIEVLDNKKINLYLVGDPKQDLRGRNEFRKLIKKYKDQVEYRIENYRCPILHVKLANHYVSDEEKQEPQTLKNGEINFVFESDIDVASFIKDNNWDCVYIYKKNDRFMTHDEDIHKNEQNLSYELMQLIRRTDIKESEVNQYIYILKKSILKVIHKWTNSQIFKILEDMLSIKLTNRDMGKLGEVLNHNRFSQKYDGILVKTIDRVKGLEGERCIFILTKDLVPYLIGEKIDQNKMLNYLYVALTRAKEKLILLVTTEVEVKYSKETINKKLNALL